MTNLWYDTHRRLTLGDRGQDVKQLQIKLQSALGMNPELVPNGIFDRNTENAIIKFQKDSGLIEDGIVGPVTHAVVFRSKFKFAPVSPPVVLQRSQWVCWAASLESVLGRSWIGRKQLSVSELQNKYQRFIQQRGSINSHALLTIGRELRFRDITNHFRSDRRLYAEKLIKLLNAKRPLLLLNLRTVGHARIIYGVEINQGSIFVMLMDPMVGYTNVPLGNIQPTNAVLSIFAANEVHL